MLNFRDGQDRPGKSRYLISGTRRVKIPDLREETNKIPNFRDGTKEVPNFGE